MSSQHNEYSKKDKQRIIKIFISQPMRGKTNNEIMYEREQAILQVKTNYKDEKIEIIDSYFRNYDGNVIQLLGKSIELLAKADLVVFVSGWDKARGCRVEEYIATSYELKCLYL